MEGESEEITLRRNIFIIIKFISRPARPLSRFKLSEDINQTGFCQMSDQLCSSGDPVVVYFCVPYTDHPHLALSISRTVCL